MGMGTGEMETGRQGDRATCSLSVSMSLCLSLRHLITAFDQGLQNPFFVTDEDCKAAGLRISGLSPKDNFTAVIERGLGKAVEGLFRKAARNRLINGRDLFDPLGGFDEKPLIASS